jgi:hypothetical protein
MAAWISLTGLLWAGLGLWAAEGTNLVLLLLLLLLLVLVLDSVRGT